MVKEECEIDFSDFEDDKKPEPELNTKVSSEEDTGATGDVNVEEEDTEFKEEQLSDKPIGEKYIRVELNGQTVKVKDIKIIGAKESDLPYKSLKGKCMMKKCQMTVYFDTENNDREYVSGVFQYVQDDGTLSLPTVNPKGKSQAKNMYELVAKKLGKKDATELSMKEFYGFIKHQHPMVKIETQDIEYDSVTHKKNIIVEIL